MRDRHNILLTFFYLFTVFLFGQKNYGQNSEWLLANYSITFKIKNAGFTVDGKMNGLTTKINFDDTKTTGNLIEASIESKWIDTGNQTRDSHLKKEEYFDVAKFPKIILKQTMLGKEKDGSYRGYFKLTMKGTTKDVLLPFTFSTKDNKGLFVGNLTINRLDFNIGKSSLLLADNVTITIQANVIKK